MILLKNYIFSIGCHSTRPPLSSLVFLYQVLLWYNIVFLVFLASVYPSWCLLQTVLTFVTPLFFLSVGAYLDLLLLSIKMYGFLYISQKFAGFSLMKSLPHPIHFFSARSFRRLKNILEFDSTLKIILRNVLKTPTHTAESAFRYWSIPVSYRHCFLFGKLNL